MFPCIIYWFKVPASVYRPSLLLASVITVNISWYWFMSTGTSFTLFWWGFPVFRFLSIALSCPFILFLHNFFVFSPLELCTKMPTSTCWMHLSPTWTSWQRKRSLRSVYPNRESFMWGRWEAGVVEPKFKLKVISSTVLLWWFTL